MNRVRMVRVGSVSHVEGPQQEPLESTTGIEVIVSLEKESENQVMQQWRSALTV